MADNYTEMVHVLEDVARVNRAVTRPFIENKTGLKVVDEGEDHGMIVTEADKKVSLYLLDGGIEGIQGLRESYPGSFSEEDDSSKRLKGKTIYQVDPLDGTGDFKDTYESNNIIGPTTLVSKLQRNSLESKFSPVSGMIFDTLNEIALISDGKDIGLYKVDKDGKIKDIKYDVKEFNPPLDDKLMVNRRVCYPQLTFDGPFMDFLSKNGLNIERTIVGGAGTLGLQLFRNYIEPKEFVKGFSDLESISVLFNAQPDWKTWDTNPTDVIANALGLPKRTDIYGGKLTENAANKELQDMHHTKGYVLSPNKELHNYFTEAAKEFQERNPDVSLLKKNYDYTKEIFNLIN